MTETNPTAQSETPAVKPQAPAAPERGWKLKQSPLWIPASAGRPEADVFEVVLERGHGDKREEKRIYAKDYATIKAEYTKLIGG